jgi:hypothetical protein
MSRHVIRPKQTKALRAILRDLNFIEASKGRSLVAWHSHAMSLITNKGGLFMQHSEIRLQLEG